MARLASSSDSGSRSISYSTRIVTETYTLEEALEKAGRGELDPSDVYAQLPEPLKGIVNQIAQSSFRSTFGSLSLRDRCTVMGELLKKARAPERRESRPMTLLEVLKAARGGEIDAVEIFDQLPEGFRGMLDDGARTLSGESFCAASPETRGTLMGMFIDVAEGRTPAPGVAAPPRREVPRSEPRPAPPCPQPAYSSSQTAPPVTAPTPPAAWESEDLAQEEQPSSVSSSWAPPESSEPPVPPAPPAGSAAAPAVTTATVPAPQPEVPMPAPVAPIATDPTPVAAGTEPTLQASSIVEGPPRRDEPPARPRRWWQFWR